VTWLNLTYYQDLLAHLRGAIASGTVQEAAREIAGAYAREAEKNT
jgi:queuine/archaeosine tRNA-ribosyltransferase